MIRFLLLVLATAAGVLLAPPSLSWPVRLLVGVGFFAALFVAALGMSRLRPVSARSVIAGAFGALLGLAVGRLLASACASFGPFEERWLLLADLFLAFTGCILGYDHGGALLAPRGDASSAAVDPAGGENANFVKNKILDTSTIIDGRILDVSKTGYLEGIYLVPRFVLQELQLLSDSSDSQKRIRGRRGMDLVNKMQKSRDMLVQIIDKDFSDTRQVDNKLINLAKEIGGAIVTTDFNLMKTAQIQGVKTFNINQLAEALKPVVLPGQMMDVLIVKPGKDPNQGIGYLEDGTMIVVENASRSVNKKRKVEVTSVIQTETGRMIFGK